MIINNTYYYYYNYYYNYIYFRIGFKQPFNVFMQKHKWNLFVTHINVLLTDM